VASLSITMSMAISKGQCRNGDGLQIKELY
jgi:hypothetical protein